MLQAGRADPGRARDLKTIKKTIKRTMPGGNGAFIGAFIGTRSFSSVPFERSNKRSERTTNVLTAVDR